MLGTLMKYEFKAVGRLLLPLYGAWILTAVILGLSFRLYRTTSGIWQVIMTGSTTLYGLFSAAAVILTAFILIQRFYKNLLGNEGYFMFALPVTTGKHLLNKTISAVVWLFIGCAAAILTGLIISVADEGTQVFHTFAQFWNDVVRFIFSDGKSALIVLEFLALAILYCGEVAAKIYAAIAVGHQWGSHRVLGAIGAYIGFGILELILVSILGRIADTDRINGLITWLINDADHFFSCQMWLLGIFISIAVLLAAYWFVTWKLLDKRLNLE